MKKYIFIYLILSLTYVSLFSVSLEKYARNMLLNIMYKKLPHNFNNSFNLLFKNSGFLLFKNHNQELIPNSNINLLDNLIKTYNEENDMSYDPKKTRIPNWGYLYKLSNPKPVKFDTPQDACAHG